MTSATTRVLLQGLRIGGLGVVGLTAGAWLSGYFFLWSIGLAPHTATPLTPVLYGLHYGEDARVRVRLIGATVGGFGAIAIVLGITLLPRRPSLHGDARYASRREIAQAGLLATNGILLGRLERRYLMLAGQQGVALAAPPRSGKGVGVVVPNCLNWPGSLVCIDIKGENWAITAGYRKAQGQAVYRFDPFAESGKTVRWNPLSYVSAVSHLRINDLQRIATMLYADAPGTDPFWTASARSLFLGIALYLFETPGLPRTLGEILRQGMASDDEGFGKHWKRVIEDRARNRKALPALTPQCVQALCDVIDLAPVTASSIRKTFTSRLDLWLNPMLDAATSASDFDFRELRKRPMSIYVCVNPDDLHRLRPVMNLFFQQAIGLQTRELPEHNPELKHQVLMILDEFTALGRIPIIAEAIAYLPGYNVRTVLVIQTPAQLREVYGRENAETMMKSLAARVVFAPKDHADAQEISDELGFRTVRAKSHSRPGWGAARAPTTTSSEQRRALLLAQEVKELGNDQALIFYEGLRPVRGKKIRYFEDRILQRRLRNPPDVEEIKPPATQDPRAGPKPDATDAANEAAQPADEVVQTGPQTATIVEEPTPETTDTRRVCDLEAKDFEVDPRTLPAPRPDMTAAQYNDVIGDLFGGLSQGESA